MYNRRAGKKWPEPGGYYLDAHCHTCCCDAEAELRSRRSSSATRCVHSISLSSSKPHWVFSCRKWEEEEPGRNERARQERESVLELAANQPVSKLETKKISSCNGRARLLDGAEAQSRQQLARDLAEQYVASQELYSRYPFDDNISNF